MLRLADTQSFESVFKMPIAIYCPECSKKYVVSSKFLGKKVTCSTEGCGAKFLAAEQAAAPDAPSEPEVFEEVDFSEFEELPPIDSKRKLQPIARPDTSDETPVVSRPAKRQSTMCRFGAVDRLMMAAGFSCSSSARYTNILSSSVKAEYLIHLRQCRKPQSSL